MSFEAVARRRSITQAAAERFITQSAMSRQIQALEDDIGTPLFLRRHRALELTPAGQQLHAASAALLASLRETLAAIRAPGAREVLSLTTTPSFASLWLIPRLTGFTRDHPGIDVRLDASFERRDLKREGFDLSVRYGTLEAGTGQRLFAESIVPVCSPLLRRRGRAPLRTPQDLAQHTLLQISVSAQGMPLEWDSWLRAQGQETLQPLSTLTFSSYNEAMAAAVAGHGVALGRRPLIDDLIKTRRLVALFGSATAGSHAYFLTVEPTARLRPAVQALERWLLEQSR